MVDILFKPFDITLWFCLGFTVFLANLGRGGGFNFQYRGGGGGGGPSGPQAWDMIHEAIQWVQDHAILVISLALLGFILINAITAVMLWLRSRGIFMEIDNLAFGRGLVVKPWREFRQHGNSLFIFNFVAGFIVSLFTYAVMALAGYIMWPDIMNRVVGENMIWGFIVLVAILPLTWVNYVIMEMLLIDFIAPTMYLFDLRVGDAWKLWYQQVFRGHFWVLCLFYLMKILLGFAVIFVVLFAFCMTLCIAYCIAIIPYIGTVMMLPIFVFQRCYTLYFLEQFGEPWRLFVYDRESQLCVSCGYDLRGNPNATHCPECGMPLVKPEQNTGPTTEGYSPVEPD